MIARKGLQRAAGAAVLAGAALVMASGAEARCAGHFFVGESEGIFATTTGIAARAEWRAQVRENIGANFALWSRATRRSTGCSRRNSSERWVCVARAIPCSD